MPCIPGRCRCRRGIAAVEMALVAPVLFTLLVGIWEVGRFIMVENILDNAAREGGRLASSNAYFASSNHLDPSQTPNVPLVLPPPSTNVDFEVQRKVTAYVRAAGLSTTGMTVRVQNTGQPSNVLAWNYLYSADSDTGTGSGYDPAAAANQLDRLTVTISLPSSSVGWSLLGRFINPSATLLASSHWPAMRNTPLVVSTTIPGDPLQSGDPSP